MLFRSHRAARALPRGPLRARAPAQIPCSISSRLDPSLAPPRFRLHAVTRLPDSSARSAAGLKWRAQALPSIQDVDRASALHPRQPCLPHAGAWRSEQEDPSFMVYVFFTAISAIDRNRCMVYFSCVSS